MYMVNYTYIYCFAGSLMLPLPTAPQPPGLRLLSSNLCLRPVKDASSVLAAAANRRRASQ